MALNGTSSAASLNWLASFPFTKLPLELQLWIGRFTVEKDDGITVHNPRWGLLDQRCCFASCSTLFAMPHTARAFHRPLMLHFFKYNTFDFRFYHYFADKMPLAILDPEYMANIQSVIIVHFSPLSSDSALARWAQHFCGLKLAHICISWGMHRDVEAVKLLYKDSFGKFLKLQKVNFCDFEHRSVMRPNKVIQDLTLRPGAKERRIEDVVVSFELVEDGSAKEEV